MKLLKALSMATLLFSLSLSGCAAALLAGGAAAGIGIYKYVNGELERKYPAGMQKCWQASVAAMEQYQFTIDSSTKDGISGQLNAKRADGTPITIAFELISENVTSLRVRVGSFGDRDVAERVHEKIRENFGIPPAK
ncbi:MAG: DUF3568 family protein [Planctomycetes bacterium]|nr:DUF3568 family protein [Planctomycetota bacterium]